MIQSLLLLIALSQLVCGLAKAGESAKINLDNISFIKICQNTPQLPPGQRPSGPAAAGGYFISGWTKSGKVQFVKTNEEILGKADQLPIDTSWRWHPKTEIENCFPGKSPSPCGRGRGGGVTLKVNYSPSP